MLRKEFLEWSRHPEDFSRAQLLAKIYSVRPELATLPVDPPKSGKSSQAATIGTEFFKGPKVKEQTEKFLLEPEILQRLAGADLPLAVPRVTTVSTDPPFFAEECLEGIELATLSDANARSIGLFMAAMPKYFSSPDDPKKYAMMGEPGSDSAEVSEVLARPEVQKILGPLLPACLKAADKVAGFKPVMMHGDLIRSNILMDETTGEATGVVDFGYARFRLPQAELWSLSGECYPPDFVDKIRAAYSEAQDQKIEKSDIISWGIINQAMQIPQLIKDRNESALQEKIERISVLSRELSEAKPGIDPPVLLKNDFTPSAESVSLLKTLEATGLKTAILTGGALRDRYLGQDDKINDYDIMADFGSLIDLYDKNKKEDFPKNIAAYLEQTLKGVSDMRISDLSERAGTMAMTLKFQFQGKEVSLSINDCGISLETSVGGDAPINTIAMDSSGRVMAHPLFEEHIRKKIYEPFAIIPAERAQQRFDRLKEKIPGLH
jgi:hypothetical protein